MKTPRHGWRCTDPRALGAALLISLSLLALHAQATTYYVDEALGNNAFDGLSDVIANGDGPKLNVSSAIAVAVNGSPIIVADGFYEESVWDPGTKSLTLNPQDNVNICDADLCGADTIGDGVLDWWRLQYFGTPLATDSVSCAACDPDGDGYSNFQEYLAGTDPTNSVSQPSPLAVSPANLPPGISGDISYTNVMTASGGWPPYTYAVTGGALPPGLSLNSTNGVLSGIPKADGTNTFTITATDAYAFHGSQSCSLVISLYPTNMPPFSQQISWYGGGGVPDCCAATRWMPVFQEFAMGCMRGSFNYTGNSTNEDSFQWAKVQLNGSNDWNWTAADAQMAYLTNFHARIVIQNNAFAPYNTNNCPDFPCNLDQDPPWVSGMTTQQYAQALGTFITALAQRYGSNQWGGVLWGIEPENEPDYGGAPPHLGYLAHILILSNCQPARAYTRIVGWTAQGAMSPLLTELIDEGLTNYVDAISFHDYSSLFYNTDPSSGCSPTNIMAWAGGLSHPGRIDQFLNWCQTQLHTNLPVLVDEFGLPDTGNGTNDPMQYAKSLILLRSAGADFIQILFPWWGNTDGFFVPTPAGRECAWTAYWLQNHTNTATLVSSNALIWTFGTNATFAWTWEGTTRGCTVSGWTAITDLYGNDIGSPTQLTENVIVLRGSGAIALASSPPCPAITLSPTNLPSGTNGAVYGVLIRFNGAYGITITSSGGTFPYAYAVTGGSLPPGLSLDSTGVLSGVPTAPGTNSFTVTATDIYSCQGSESYNLVIH